MLVEPGSDGRPVDEPPASEVVRARLLRLIAELQRAEPSPTTAASPRYALAGPVDGVEEDGGGDREGEPEEWLERLRHSGAAASGAEGARASPGVLGPAARRVAVQALAFGRDHVAAVVVVLLVGVAWSAYSVLQARSSPVAAAAPVMQSSAPVQQPSATPTPEVVVHVIGAVRRPGVVHLPEGARVSDAIAAAGGLGDRAATGELNLAEVLADGVQLKIGTTSRPGGWLRGPGDPGSTSASPRSSPGDAKVSLNSATLAQLDSLPGIGPVTAQKILDWRTAHGRFTAVTELQEVDGIGPKTYADIAGHVRL